MIAIYIIVNNIHTLGGTERAVRNLADILVSRGYSVTLISLYSVPRQYSQLAEKIKVVNLGLNIASPTLSRMVLVAKRLRELCTAPESVLIGTNAFINIILAVWSLKTWRTVGCEHVIYEDASPHIRELRRFFYHKLDRVVVLNSQDQLRFMKDGVKVEIIPNTTPFYPASVPSQKLRQKRLLSIGRLTSAKGFGTIVPLVSQALRTFPDWDFVIVGDGDLKQMIIEQINAEKMEGRIYLEGFKDEVQDYYYNSSVFLSTSVKESFGLALLEAQSYGLPVVSYDAPHGPREVIGDRAGFTVPLHDEDAFLNKLMLLMTDVKMRQEFSSNARNNARRYLPEKVASRWVDLLEKL